MHGGALAGCSSSPTSPTTPRVTVTSVSPSRGGTSGGTTVTIAGSGFSDGAAVAIGGTPATDIKVMSPTSISAMTPSRTAAGTSDVTVTVGASTASLPGGFTYVAPSGTNQPPIIVAISSVGSRPKQPAGFADIGETITLVATVTDKETAPSALTYEWSGPGTFSGSGSSVSWTAPASVPGKPSPGNDYSESDRELLEGDVAQRNVSTGGYIVSVHDSSDRNPRHRRGLPDALHALGDPDRSGAAQFLDELRGRGTTGGRTTSTAPRRQYVEDFSKFRISRLPPVESLRRTFFRSATVAARGTPAARFQVHWEITYIIDVDATAERAPMRWPTVSIT